MFNSLYDWIEARTGLRSLIESVRDESIPGGARWRYVFGPALAGSFVLQLVTGLLLMSSYVPSAGQAWGSVWYIQTQMVLGWFIRGLHHFGSSAVMVLLLMHLVQVVWTRAYRAPREVNWWLGLGLASLILGLALTGYLLPWDMKGYWATKVATNIAGSTPVLGPAILKVLLGGSEYGNQTLTRLFSLHVAVLPLGVLFLLVLHVRMYYRHGASAPEGAIGAESAWPRQVFRNLLALVMVTAIVSGITLWNHGVGLEAPADPSVADYPARPEWYFLPLFQLLNYFQSPYEVIGTHVLPGLIFAFLAALPLLDKVLPRRLVHASALLVMAGIVAGAGYLMQTAIISDQANLSFQLARTKADGLRERANQLALVDGVPPEGAVYLLRRDPLTHGRAVLEESCLSCHYYAGKGLVTRTEMELTKAELAQSTAPDNLKSAGLSDAAAAALGLKLAGFEPEGKAVADVRGGSQGATLSGKSAKGEPVQVWARSDGQLLDVRTGSVQTASDLEGFGSLEWIRGLLEDPTSSRYFGTTPQLDGMKTWKKGSKLTSEELDKVADFVAQLSNVEEDEPVDQWYEDRYAGKLEEHPGNSLFIKECGDCHIVGDIGLVTEGGLQDAPDLFGYGSKRWIKRMVEHPGAENLYGYLDEEDLMPAFEGQLSQNDLETLTRYLKGEYLPVDGSAPALAKRLTPESTEKQLKPASTNETVKAQEPSPGE